MIENVNGPGLAIVVPPLLEPPRTRICSYITLDLQACI